MAQHQRLSKRPNRAVLREPTVPAVTRGAVGISVLPVRVPCRGRGTAEGRCCGGTTATGSRWVILASTHRTYAQMGRRTAHLTRRRSAQLWSGAATGAKRMAIPAIGCSPLSARPRRSGRSCGTRQAAPVGCTKRTDTGTGSPTGERTTASSRTAQQC